MSAQPTSQGPDVGSGTAARQKTTVGAARGETIIGDAVVAKIARRAVTEVDGAGAVTQTAFRRMLPWSTGSGLARASVDRGEVTLSLTVDVVYPRSVAAVTAEMRSHLVHRLAELCGMIATRIDITVSDLVAPSEPSRSWVQ